MEKEIILDRNNKIEISNSFIDGFISIELTGDKSMTMWAKQNTIENTHDILDSINNHDLVKAKNGYFIATYYSNSMYVSFSRNFRNVISEWLKILFLNGQINKEVYYD